MYNTQEIMNAIEKKGDKYLDKSCEENGTIKDVAKATIWYAFGFVLDCFFLIGAALVIVLDIIAGINWFREKFKKKIEPLRLFLFVLERRYV